MRFFQNQSFYLCFFAQLLFFELCWNSAQAIEIETVPGLFYFTTNQDLLSKAETEQAEEGLAFRVQRDARGVAREHAEEELRQGNVCLKQANQDLQLALSRTQLRKLCWRIYRDDVAQAEKNAAKEKWKIDYLRCFANVEARETSGSIRMILSFRGQVVMQDRLPSSLKRAGFPPQPQGWALPLNEAPLGAPGASWKEVLKGGSCSLEEPALNAFLERFLEQKRLAKALTRCRNLQVRDAERLVRLQAQFKKYVPDEWLKESAPREDAEVVLAPPVGLDAYAGIEECRMVRRKTAEQMANLQKISSRIADRHDLPVLDPDAQPGFRAPASVDPDLQD